MLEILMYGFLVWAMKEVVSDGNKSENNEDNNSNKSRTLTGYDPYRGVHWRLEQKYKISDD